MSHEAFLLFGASRGTGFALAQRLTARGAEVTAVLRSDAARPELEKLGIRVVSGDAGAPGDVARAFAAAAGGAAVVSTLGGSAAPADAAPPFSRVDEIGNRHVIDAAVSMGNRRFVLVTSIGCGEMARFRSPQAVAAFGDLVDAKTRAEDHLRATKLDWTIVRPGGLRDGPATGRGLLTTDAEVHGFIRRSDLARLVERVLDAPAAIGHALAAVDADEARCVRPLVPFALD